MPRRGQSLRTLSLMVCVALAAGCSRSVSWMDEQERAQPLIQKARTRVNLGDVESAIRLYTAALEYDPRLAVAHLDLALLLHDNEQARDYVRAIYHYQRYLELRPTAEKRQMIEDRIRLARQLLAADLARTDRSAERSAALERENQQLKAQIAALEGENPQLKERIAALEGEVERLRQGLAAARQQTAPAGAAARSVPREPSRVADASASVAGPVPAGGATGSVARAAIRTYRVQRGDTLSSIAARFYQDSSQWRRIQGANRRILGESSTLKVGQVLVIP